MRQAKTAALYALAMLDLPPEAGLLARVVYYVAGATMGAVLGIAWFQPWQ